MSHYEDLFVKASPNNNNTFTYEETKSVPKDHVKPNLTLEQRIEVLESNYSILETALTQLEHANQHNLKERDDAYALLGELLVKGIIQYEANPTR